jgi:hypothetical protein
VAVPIPVAVPTLATTVNGNLAEIDEPTWQDWIKLWQSGT